MKILVTFALGNEFAPWRKIGGFKRASTAVWDQTYEAQIGAADVRVILTGVGRIAAQRAMVRAFDEVPDFCIASGLAGGLKPDYHSGEILVARAVAEIQGTRLIPSDCELLLLAEKLGATVAGKLLISDKVVSTVEEKRRLSASGDAVEMEGAYILGAAVRRGVRSVAIRSVSDVADARLPLDFNRVFDGQGRVSVAKVMRQIVFRPHRIMGLLRLAQESQRAAGNLASFLDMYVRSLASSPLPELAKADAIAL